MPTACAFVKRIYLYIFQDHMLVVEICPAKRHAIVVMPL
jgi:hypothetical protein